MKRDRRNYLLIALVLYIVWLLSMDVVNPIWVPVVLILVSILIPYLCLRIVKNRSFAIPISLLLTPLVLFIILYVLSLGDFEARTWLGVLVLMVLVGSAPVWIACTLIFGAKKTNAIEPARE